MHRTWISLVVIAFLCSTVVAAEPAAKTLLINDFENDNDLKGVEAGGAKLVTEGVTHGEKAMEVSGGVSLVKFPQDWSAYDALILDVTNPSDTPITASLEIFDKAWETSTSKYWDRHNGGATFGPGKTSWIIPVQGMYRGEAGSRNNNIKRNIDADSITRVVFGFQGKVIIDNLRLVKVEAPKGVWAFDMGPTDQAVALGWKPVSNMTKYDDKSGYGWESQLPPSNARDTTFGPSLLRDFVECGGHSFRVNVPEGKYTVTVFYENSGYWDGEQARQKTRKIEVGGSTVWKDDKADGSANYLYRFENVEPIGVDIWDTYMAPELAKPGVFEATAGKEGLTLNFSADTDWGSRVSGIAIRKADDEAAAKWLKSQLDDMATEFRGMAVCLDKPAKPVKSSELLGYLAWPVKIEDTVTPNSVPAQQIDPAKLELSAIAVQGEYEPLCVAIRPMKDFGKCTLRLEGGAEGVEATTGVVWYSLSRGFGSLAYHVVPHTLRQQSTVNLPKDITREIVVTCKVSDKAAAGDAKWTLIIEDADKKAVLSVPLKLTVHAVKLDRQTDYSMGFFGMEPQSGIPKDERPAVLDDTLRQLKEHGMNALSGGANFAFKGFKDGQPQFDFTDMDAFVALATKNGFTHGINGYGAAHLLGINDGYEVGETGKRIAKEAGMPYEEVLMKIWKAVDEHARAANWPLIYYVICDETRVRDVAERELEFMNLMAKVSKAYPKTLRTSGAYSVSFNTRPTDKNDLLYWHQRFFSALDISALGGHDQSVMTEATKLGKEIQIYNQGIDRYSFGLYQWSEFRKGVKARWQWHLTIIHGYQFFDLDGREPDSQIICYGRKGVIPTVAFERCREGAEDFYLCQTLWNMIEKGAGTDDARAKAKSLLEGMTNKIGIGQRQPPAGYDADQFKAQLIGAIESLK